MDKSLCDKYIEVKVHAGKTVDFVGQAMNQYFATYSALSELFLSIRKNAYFSHMF